VGLSTLVCACGTKERFMKKEDLNGLIDKGLEFYKSGDFKKAINYFTEASLLGPDNPDNFNYWGKAFSGLAKNDQDETLFRKSIEKYAKAVELKPDNDFAFNNWGNALSDLGKIKQDESLFMESFEKYAKAVELKPDYASAFNNWGNALSNLAKIKEDESLFMKSFEKYAKAVELKSDYASAFYNWGVALYDLAKIKQDESLFRESCEKYEKAAQINHDDREAFNNWGVALSDLAKIKQDESLFMESIEKYNKATAGPEQNYFDAFFNLGNTYYDLAKIKQDESLYKKVTECFIKSKLDILNILVSFDDKKDREHIAQTEILYPLLDSETNDGKIFKETTRDIKDTEELKKYKDAYISSMLIISQLYVNNENKNEKLVAYYCKKKIAQEMLFGKSRFHLNAINYSNDPTEGSVLLEYLFEGKKSVVNEPQSMEYIAFAGCFIFNYDSLNQFRLYGKEDGREGTGLSLVFKDTFFSKEAKMAITQREDINADGEEGKHSLFRCIYIDPETQWIDTVGHKETYLFYQERKDGETKEDIDKKITEYRKYIDDVIGNVRREMKNLIELVEGLKPSIVEQLLINLRYLIKHIAFKEEQECRIVKVYSINDHVTNISDNSEQIYVRYKPKVASHIEKVCFGPKAIGMELFQRMLSHKSLDIECKKSKNPLA
jgi:tetratricopeptide (TPR) repeat protein